MKSSTEDPDSAPAGAFAGIGIWYETGFHPSMCFPSGGHIREDIAMPAKTQALQKCEACF